jgi:hypothetical protein
MGTQREGFWGRSWRPVLADSRAPRSAAEPDWAEMGTAFGLDASLAPATHAPVPAPAKGDPGASEGLWAANRLNGRSVI